MRRFPYLVLLILMGLLTACSPQTETATETPLTAEPATSDTANNANAPTEKLPARLVISEVMAGIDGNNPYDYIELYNAGDEPADLRGYFLEYRLTDDNETTLIMRWNDSILVPPHGHYLIGQEGQDFLIKPDAWMNQSLVGGRGGLVLRDGDTLIDALVWGNGPQSLTEGNPAADIPAGAVLERLPGGSAGSAEDSNDNAADFVIADFQPQNTGSAITPETAPGLTYTLTGPDTVAPGGEFTYTLSLENQGSEALESLEIQLTLPDILTLIDTGAATASDHQITWQLDSLAAGASETTDITLQAPWTFTTLLIHSSYAEAANDALARFAAPQALIIGGGAIPIETARSLIGQEVVVEGTTTMYTDGFFAGSGAKFYIEDETGGIQIYVANAAGTLNIPIGIPVRVRGVITPYRDSIELIPERESYIERLDGTQEEWPATSVAVANVATDTLTWPGKLVEVEGTIARLEEFTYSYEVDLVSDEGQLVTCYVDKETGMTLENIEQGARYLITGIVELIDGRQQIYPRLASDFVRIYPPVLLVDATLPSTVAADETFTGSIRATNHTASTMQDLVVIAPIPSGLTITTVNGGGAIEDDTIRWEVAELAGDGELIRLTFEANVNPGLEYLTFENYTAQSAQWTEPAIGEPLDLFAGDTVPIWAIQGRGNRSPYTQTTLSTEGIVTGVFEDLEGFWIQESQTDNDPQTSAGIFVYTSNASIGVSVGDLVRITGPIHEYYQQTEIDGNLIDVLSSGNALPAPVLLNPPATDSEARAYFETLEGMLVSVPGTAQAVSPASRYGEFAVVLNGSVDRHVMQGGDTGIVIRVDDGSDHTYTDQADLPYPVNTGDTLTNLLGPLAFTFGDYKIEPTQPLTVTSKAIIAPSLPELAVGEFSLMTWNVENLFDFVEPHPSSPPLATVREYKIRIDKVASSILAAGAPSVIGLQEVENIDVLQDIAEHEALAAYGYEAVLIEGDDSRGIDVGYLIRSDHVTLLHVEQFPAPNGITSRPPLLVSVEFLGEVYHILNNHFTSMSGGEAATEPRRNAQALWNVSIMQDLLADDPDAHIIVMGDLNSYYDALPIDSLRDAGLLHVMQSLDAAERYTYIYNGVAQVLDHILVTPAMMETLSHVTILHLNADYTIPFADDTGPVHLSDHDPLIAIFTP